MASKKEKGLLWQIEETLEVVTENIAQYVVMTIATGIEIEVKAVVMIIAVGENQAVIRIMIDVTRGKMKVVVIVEMLVMTDVKILVIEAEAILRVEILVIARDILGMIEIEGENDQLEGKVIMSDLNVAWLTESRRLWERGKESRMVGAMRCPR